MLLASRFKFYGVFSSLVLGTIQFYSVSCCRRRRRDGGGPPTPTPPAKRARMRVPQVVVVLSVFVSLSSYMYVHCTIYLDDVKTTLVTKMRI